MNLSPQQQAVVAWTRTSGSAFVEAVAGAGKTTTLIELLKSTEGTVAFTAYNKKIAQEIEAKVSKLGLGNRVKVGTFHSFGFGAWRRIHPAVKVDQKAKNQEIVAYLDHNADRLVGGLSEFVLKLISLAKQRALGLFGAVEDKSLWFDIVDHFDLANEIEDTNWIEMGIDFAIRG